MSNREHSPSQPVTSGDWLTNSTVVLHLSLEEQIPTLDLSSLGEQSQISQDESADVERPLQLEDDPTNDSAESDSGFDEHNPFNYLTMSDVDFDEGDPTNYLAESDFESNGNPGSEIEDHEAAWIPRVYCSKQAGCIAENHCMNERRRLKWKYDCLYVVADFRDELIRRWEACKTEEQANGRAPVGRPRGYSTERGVTKLAWFTEDMLLMVRTPREARDPSSIPGMSAGILLGHLDDLTFMEPGSTLTRADGAEYWFECVASHR